MRTLLFFISFFLMFFCHGQNKTRDFIDPFSTTSCYVISKKGTNPLMEATCFFIRVNNTNYLITNNHVLGLEFFINEYKNNHKDSLPPEASIPDNLDVRIYGDRMNSYNEIISLFDSKKTPLFIKLYDDEINKKDILDVVAIPLKSPNYINFKYNHIVLDSSYLKPDLRLYPSSELFVVGFPGGYGYTNFFPIWKKGTIANDITRSIFFIDATTRGGMSGSPVYLRSNYFETTNGDKNSITPFVTYLIGIYSAQSYHLELGVVIDINKIFSNLKQISE